MTGPRPWLSVITPTFNGARFLKETLQSICAQQDTAGIEVILIDDGSTDESLAIARSFSRRLPLMILSRAHSGNWVARTNEGLSFARGDYVCWLHQDDRWHPQRLKVLRGLVNRHREVDLFVHPVSFIDDRGRVVGQWRCPLPAGGKPLSPRDVVPRLLVQNFLSTAAPLFKASAALRAGPADEALWYAADWDFWLRLASAGKTYHCPQALASFRVHRGSQTVARANAIASQLDIVVDRHIRDSIGAVPEIRRVAEVARFSRDVNAALARLACGQPFGFLDLLRCFVRLGPRGWRRYVHDSRITERVACRLRAGLCPRPMLRRVRLPQAAPENASPAVPEVIEGAGNQCTEIQQPVEKGG